MFSARAHIILGVLFTALLMSSCDNEMKNQQPFELEVRLAVSAPIMPKSSAPMMRVFGDPGTTETFDFPKYAYIYMVWSEDGTAEKTHVEIFPKETLDPQLWSKAENELTYYTTGDPVYVYTQKFFKLLESKQRKWGRLYVAVSYEDITPYVKGKTGDKATIPESEDQVKEIAFLNNTSTRQAHVQDIYSTPYNYLVEGKYYGEIANFGYDESAASGSKVAYANLLLYHVAAKVDVMWNVAEDKRGEMKLSYLAAENLYDGDCYLFKPNENAVDAAKYTSDYTKELATNNIGTQWNGRAYFYTIPYKNNAETKVFPLQLRMLKNGDSPKIPAVLPSDEPTDRGAADYYHLIQNTSMPANAVFTPWIRCQMSINKVLEYSATPVEFPVSTP